MTSTVNIEKSYIKYNNHKIEIAFNNTPEVYFNANQVCKLLGHGDCEKALKTHVKGNKTYSIKAIDPNYKQISNKYNDDTKFLNEPALMMLILESKNEPLKIIRWICNQVMPVIREHIYKQKFGDKIEKLNNLRQKLENMKQLIEDRNNEYAKLKKKKRKTK